jgi:hypothetical protein
LKVGSEPITNLAGWDRALRSNQDKPVQVTILRDRKQQTVTLQVDSKRHGELIWPDAFPNGAFPNGDGALVAEIEPDIALFDTENEAAAKALRDQAETLKIQIQNQIRGMVDGQVTGQIDAQEAEQFRKQAQDIRDKLKVEEFKIDPKQMEEFKQQMDEFQKKFKPEDFKIDPKRLDEWKQQLDQLRKQMDEWKMVWDNPA